MKTRFAKHMKALHQLTGEVGTLGESDERYASVYAKLSDALDAAEEAGLLTNVETDSDSPSVFYTAKRFGKDPRQGIHLLQPTPSEINQAIESAHRDMFAKIYIHAE